MAVLLGDAVGVAYDPDVIVRIESAPVDTHRHLFRIAPGIDEIALKVEQHHRRCGDGGLRFFLGDVLSIDDQNVVVCVYTGVAESCIDPAFREWFRPRRIDDELLRCLRHRRFKGEREANR